MKRIDLVKCAAAAVLATGLLGAVAAAPAVAAPVAPVPAPSTPLVATSWQDLLPPQLDCLISTGWAAFCLGIPLP